jgi:hypothetical protein
MSPLLRGVARAVAAGTGQAETPPADDRTAGLVRPRSVSPHSRLGKIDAAARSQPASTAGGGATAAAGAAAPQRTRPTVTLSDGTTYRYEPSLTEEGRREAADRAAYEAFAARRPNAPAYEAAAGHWAALNAQEVGRESRGPSDAENRAVYDRIPAAAFPQGRKPAYEPSVDWGPLYQGYVRGEMGQQNRIEIRVPRSHDDGRLTPLQQRTIARDQAEAQMRSHVRRVGAERVRPEDYFRISRASGGAVSQADLIEVATDEARKVERIRRQQEDDEL